MEIERLIHATTSLCRTCKDAVPAQVVATAAGQAWMRKVCDQHGAQEVMLSDDAAWYERTRAMTSAPRPPRRAFKPIELGCPFDCGSCDAHEQKVRLPVVTITSSCNLDCPICYVHNKNEGAYHMAHDELRKILAHLRDEHGDVDILNFTGGEPTLHPHFLEFIELARDAGIHRVSICSNGIALAQNEALVARLAELGARVALSFDTFELEADYALQGAHLVELKLRCLDLLEKHQVDTTLIPVMTRGVNDHEIGRIIEYALTKRCVRHVEVHTMTYTGQGGTSFPRDGRISIHEVVKRIEETTGGWLREGDFVPSPCAHPLCYQIAYVLLDPEGGRAIPFTRFVAPEVVYECLSDRLYIEPTRRLEDALNDAIARLYTEEGDEAARTLRVLRSLLAEMFPAERPITAEEALRVSERAAKAIYIHSHMDEETFDVERVAQCCDSNCYPDGSTIPVCSYNVLYRETEEHFMMKPVRRDKPRGGHRFPSLPVVP
jgi:uncharacterized radical SAM superfamily Fe-S cluster-containing enzyme